MEPAFPELTSFGTLLKFALALEELAAGLTGEAAGRGELAALRDQLTACERKHRKRALELQRLRQERLNEIVLQPITGMERAEYLPPLQLPADATRTIATITALEETIARFYEDAASVAQSLLPTLERKLKKLASECRNLAAALL